MFWNIITTILIGALAGWIAGKIMKERGGFWFNAALGIAGSFVGYAAAGIIGITASKVSIGGIGLSVLGACLIIWIVRAITGKKK
jgi:uncharacterized membrane protein YeaQ/YmgE (transglycosylase-associated protein family)